MLLLTTTGRTSGISRATPLLYVQDDDQLVLVASNWGQPRHPAWSNNLLANPDVIVQVHGQRWPAKARLATDADRARLWSKVLDVWPAYQTYADRSGREIRVFMIRRTGQSIGRNGV